MVCDTETKMQKSQQGTVLGHSLSICIATLLAFIGDIRMKKCAKCKEPKSLLEFYKNRSKKDGLQNYCKSCAKIYQQSETFKTYQKRYQKVYQQTKKGKDAIQRAMNRFCNRYPERRKAKDAVKIAIIAGKIPNIKTRRCYFCYEQAK